MICRRDTTWPFLCTLVCLFILSAVSPNIWEWAVRSWFSEQSSQIARTTHVLPVPHAVQAPKSAADTDGKVVEADGSAEIDKAPRANREFPREVTDYHSVEPALKIAENRDVEDQDHLDPGDSDANDSDMAELEFPMLKPPARPVSLPQDVTHLPPEDAEATPPTGMPRTIYALPYRVALSKKNDYPSTGLLPVQLVPAGDADPRLAPRKTSRVEWETPVALLRHLHTLSKEAATNQWAAQAKQLVCQLGRAVSGNPDETTAILHQLQTLNGQALSLAGEQRSQSLAAELLRTSYALQRRLDIWHQVFDPDSTATATSPPRGDLQRLASVLAVIDAVTSGSPQGKPWRKFLLVDDLQEWLDKHGTGSQSDPLPAELAGCVLDRLAGTPMTVSQRQFAASEPVVALRRELRCWVTKPADASQLLKYIERYERTRLASDAKRVARNCLELDLSLDGNHRELAGRLSEHYRNANVRIAISGALLNRFMPQREPEYGKVRDTVLGVRVRGKSLTSANVGVRLIPNPDRVRLALEVKGEVAALTTSTAGPATFHNSSETMYTARKPLEIDLKGIHLSPAKVFVHNRTNLRDVETNYDGVPLLDPLAKRVASKKHEQNREAANQEIKRKVAAQARKRIDREADVRLTETSRRLQERIVAPMETLALEPTMIHAKTTADRFTMRLRLAGENQLGGTTPRPRAPSDSLASFQIHETAVNNAIEHLDLDGRTFTLPQLAARVSKRFHLKKSWEMDPNYNNVTITFADRDAVDVRCQDDQVVVTLSIARLRKPPRGWRNFQVRAFYKPKIEGCSAELVRDGILHLMGKRMSTGAQIPIRGVFARVFSKKQPVPLTPELLLHDQRMSGLAITQFTIADGWVGIALGPKRPERQPERTALQQWLLWR